MSKFNPQTSPYIRLYGLHEIFEKVETQKSLGDVRSSDLNNITNLG